MYKHEHAHPHTKRRPGFEPRGIEHRNTAGERHQSQQEAICNRMSALLGLGSHVTHTQITNYTQSIHVSLVALPASGSSLMHADCKLEPLGKEPSGSVCLVDQSAFTEVPVTALDPPTPPPASGDSMTVTKLIS